jgi:hypothetical protein
MTFDTHTLQKLAENGVPESTMLALMGHMSRAMLEPYSPSEWQRSAKLRPVSGSALWP